MFFKRFRIPANIIIWIIIWIVVIFLMYMLTNYTLITYSLIGLFSVILNRRNIFMFMKRRPIATTIIFLIGCLLSYFIITNDVTIIFPYIFLGIFGMGILLGVSSFIIDKLNSKDNVWKTPEQLVKERAMINEARLHKH